LASTQQRVEESPKLATGRPSPFRALYNPRYRLLWSASFFSISMWMMQMVARGWLVLEITNSPFYVTLAAALGSLPMLVFPLLGGVLADRFDRRMLLIGNDVVAAIAYAGLAALVFLNMVEFWHVIVVSVVSGISFALSMPSRQAIIPNLVRREDLGNAVALSTVMFSGGQTIGPALAGMLVAVIGLSWTLLFTAVGLAVPVILLSLLRLEKTTQVSHHDGIVTNLVEGFKYAKASSLILSLITLGGVSTIFVMPYQALMPVFARDILHSGSQGLGLLLGSAGIGALIGSIFLASIDMPSKLGKILIVSGVIGGLSLIPFALSPVFTLSLVLSFFVGLMMQLQMTSNFTTVQLVVPDEFRGRVLSMRMVIFGMMPLGQMLLGWISEVMGAQIAVAIFGAVAASLMAITVMVSKDIRAMWNNVTIR